MTVFVKLIGHSAIFIDTFQRNVNMFACVPEIQFVIWGLSLQIHFLNVVFL